MKKFLPAIFVGVAVFGSGCATYRVELPPPVDKAEAIALVKQGVPDEVIMRRIDDSHSVFYLSASEVVELRQAGLSDRLVTYMMYTRTREAIEQTHRAYQNPHFHGSVGVIYTH